MDLRPPPSRVGRCTEERDEEKEEGREVTSALLLL